MADFQTNPNIPLMAQAANPLGAIQGGLQLGQEIMQMPVQNQLLQQKAQQQQQVLAANQAKAEQAERQRRLLSVATSYSGVQKDIDAGKYEDAAVKLEQNKKVMASQGITNFKETDYAINALRSNDATAINQLSKYGESVIEHATAQGLGQFTPAKQAPFQQGSGDMSGFIFNPNTGAYSIDPKLKQTLEIKAQKAANKGKPLTFKDKQGLNKDVTGIIKKAVEIKRSAGELDDLKTLGTAAAKLGAVFKFMKALDPTSVVRETEQGQVYAASGAASQLAGSINSMLGSGKLTAKGFDDLVITAKTIANSNVESVGGEIDSLLDSFGESIPEDFKNKVRGRVPGSFDMPTNGSTTVDISVDDFKKMTKQQQAAYLANAKAKKGL